MFFGILWDIVVFRLGFVFAEYVEFYDKSHIYEFWYNFDTVVYQFLKTGTSDRTLIDIDQLIN